MPSFWEECEESQRNLIQFHRRQDFSSSENSEFNVIRLPQDEPIGWSELRFGTKCHLGSCQKHEKKAHTKRAQLVLRQTHRQLIKAISTNAAELNIFATARGHAMSSSTGKRRTGSLARHEKPLPLDAASSRSSPFACSSRRLRIECHAVRAQALFKREQRCHFYNYSSFRGLLRNPRAPAETTRSHSR